MHSDKELKPKLSPDLVLSSFDNGSFLLYQRKTNKYLKVNGKLYTLLKLLDGNKNLKQIASEYNTKVSKADFIHEKDVHNLLYVRYRLFGLIDFENESFLKFEHGPPSYLALSFIIIKEKYLKALTSTLSIFFKTPLVFFILLLGLTAVTFILWNHIGLFFSQHFFLIFFDWELYLFLTISVFVHELGHASAVVHFDQAHGDIGGGFYFFKPVLYTDVSNIWNLIPKKRIIVNLSGIYFEFIFITVLLVIGHIINKENLIIISLGIGIISLVNLCPFLRTDGYWILSDLFKIHNLKKESEGRLISFFSEKRSFTLSNILLAVYAMINNFALGAFIFLYLIYNPDIIYFPQKLIGLFAEDSIGIENLGLLSPLLFYVLLVRFIIKLCVKMKTFKRLQHSNSI